MANFPTSISTDANLYVAVNGIQTTLAASIGTGDTTIQLTSVTSFPTTGAVTINNAEVVFYTGISGSSITGCTRGADGTTALAATLGVTVGLTIVAAHHNLLKNEIEAIETALGVGFALPLTVLNGGTGVTTSTGTGSVVLSTSPTLVTPALGTPSAVVLTNATGLPLTSGVTGTLPNSNTTATSSPTASDIVSRDANANSQVNNISKNFSTTATAAGTTALTVSSSPLQQFTGTTTQTVTLPDATTLTVGYQISILNRSTGSVTVNNHGGSLQSTVTGSTQATFTCTSVSTSNGAWDVSTSSAASGGTVTSVSGTTNQIDVATGTSTPVISLDSSLILPGTLQLGGTENANSNKITNLANGTASGDAVNFGQVNPGRIIATSKATSSSSTAVTSSTYQAVGPSLSYAATKTGNLLRITLTGQIQDNTGQSAFCNLTLFQDSTNLLPTAGYVAYGSNGNSSINQLLVPVALVFIYTTADTSSHTYQGYLKNSDNSSLFRFSEQGNAQILIEEIAQ